MKKDCVPYGSDVSAGTFECRDCGKRISTTSVSSLPPCSNYNKTVHIKKCWKVISGGGDAPQDPYPKR